MIANAYAAWANTADPAVPPVVIVGFALIVAVVVALWRRRLPAGLGEGLLTASVSAGAIAAVAFDAGGHLRPTPLGHVLTGLAIVWYALGRVSARAPSPTGDDPDREERLARAQVFALAGLIAGLGAFVTCTLARGNFSAASPWSPAATDYLLLLMLAVTVCVFRTGRWAPLPLCALLVWLVLATLSLDTPWLTPRHWRVILPAAGTGLLVLVLAAVIVRWRARRKAWLRDPQVVPDFPPPGRGLTGLVVLVGAAIGVFGLRFPTLGVTGPALLAAGLAVLITAHWAARVGLGALGLALAGAGIVTGCLRWIAPGWNGGVCGLALAGGYLLWLARFWQQQLDGERAWTTAGRLIAPARVLAWAAAAGALISAASAVGAQAPTPPLWADALTLLLALGAMSLFVRDSGATGAGGSAAAACLLAAAAVVPGDRLLGPMIATSLWPLAVWAAVVSLLALRIALAGGCPPGRPVYRGLLGGMFPVAILTGVSWHGFDRQALATLVLTAAALAVAFMPARDASGAAASTPEHAETPACEE